MRFKLDENLQLEGVDLLRQSGHDSCHVLDQGLGGAEDPDISDVCSKESRTLITLDAASPISLVIRQPDRLEWSC